MTNTVRGETRLRIGEREHTLCLTLGALAEIETICRADTPLSARDLLRVLAALARGGGSDLTEADLAAAPLDLDTAARAVTACLEAGT